MKEGLDNYCVKHPRNFRAKPRYIKRSTVDREIVTRNELFDQWAWTFNQSINIDELLTHAIALGYVSQLMPGANMFLINPDY